MRTVLTTCSSEQQTQPSSRWPGSLHRSGSQSSGRPDGAGSRGCTHTLRRSCRHPGRLKHTGDNKMNNQEKPVDFKVRDFNNVQAHDEVLTSSSNEQNEDQRPHGCCVILSMQDLTWHPGYIRLFPSSDTPLRLLSTNHDPGKLYRYWKSKHLLVGWCSDSQHVLILENIKNMKCWRIIMFHMRKKFYSKT